MNDNIKMEIKGARERKANFSPEEMTKHLTEQFGTMIAHDATNESIARIKKLSIDKDISVSKAIQLEVKAQVNDRQRREEARFLQSAENVMKALETIKAENERMKHELNLVFHVGIKNSSIPNDAFAEADCILIENEILTQLLPLAGNIQNIQIKAGKSVYKTGGEP